MTQFFISCKESRIEHNKSFYGSFSLGPFEGGQSLTIANALRRTLLSELKGIAIVSIQIEGVFHEYSSLPGVKDSVLDLLLNLKETHFLSTLDLRKKNPGASQSLEMFPQLGYLRVRGPGIVRASDLKLPPFLKVVDPEQYIATLAEDGFLNMKFVISEGKNYIIQKPSGPEDRAKKKNSNSLIGQITSKAGVGQIDNLVGKTANRPIGQVIKTIPNFEGNLPSKSKGNSISSPYLSLFATPSTNKTLSGVLSTDHKSQLSQGPLLRLNQLILRKIKQLSGGSFISNNESAAGYFERGHLHLLNASLSTNPNTKSDKGSGGEGHQDLTRSHQSKKTYGEFLNSNPLTLDAVFAPVNKVNYIIEYSEHKVIDSSFAYSKEVNDLLNLLKPLVNVEEDRDMNLAFKPNSLKSRESLQSFTGISFCPILGPNLDPSITTSTLKGALNEILDLKNQLGSIKTSTEYVVPSSMKHNVILEIWTNGSIHPREALYEGLKHLAQVFSKLYSIPGILNAQTLTPGLIGHISNRVVNMSNQKFNVANNLSYRPNLPTNMSNRLIGPIANRVVNMSNQKVKASTNTLKPLSNKLFSTNYTIFKK